MGFASSPPSFQRFPELARQAISIDVPILLAFTASGRFNVRRTPTGAPKSNTYMANVLIWETSRSSPDAAGEVGKWKR